MKDQKIKIAIIGGGAAGFFAAISAAEFHHGAEVTIYEKTSKYLQKVKVSGGGRCNVTHHCFASYKLAENYPRGEKQLKELFKKFQAKDTVEWFETKGVKLKIETDGRIFPVSDNSQTIIECFLNECNRLGINLISNANVTQIASAGNQFELHFLNKTKVIADKIIIATGGYSNITAYQYLNDLGHIIIPPVPSLFTFNDSQKHFADLSGLSVPNAIVKITGTKFINQGPLLITHWGLSGPAIIRLSAWAAEYLAQQQYTFTALVNFTGIEKEEELKNQLQHFRNLHPKKKVSTNPIFDLPSRLWLKLCLLAEIEDTKIWAELSQKQLNKLIENLYRCPFQIKGKTTFKEEFVTCGGIDLAEIDLETMESKKVKGLFFAGEVLNVDGITGGFNFQSAWTTGWIAGRSCIS